MLIIRLSLLFLLTIITSFTSAGAAEYGVALSATPVLNSPDFKAVFGGKDGKHLKTDSCGQVRELEYIALPGTLFKLIKQVSKSSIYQVESDDYQTLPGGKLYLDSRFLKLTNQRPERRKVVLPKRDEIISRLKAANGKRYVWGGNVPDGVAWLEKLFYTEVSISDKSQLMLDGLDCSGLLYHATDGATPRNTWQLLDYGQPLKIAGKTAAEIIAMLKPLDLIVWNGHVIIVLDQQHTIESRLVCAKSGNGGVVITDLQQRLSELLRKRKALDIWPTGARKRAAFVIRRWYMTTMPTAT